MVTVVVDMTVMREFGADPELKQLFQVYIIIAVLGGFLWWMIPTIALTALNFGIAAGLIALSPLIALFIVAAFAFYWISKFCASIIYVLEDDKITVTKGVWWKNVSYVPYNRITNITIYQGPLSRRYGLGRLSIQTAGFSGANSRGVKTAEAVIFGIKNFQEINDLIIDLVKKKMPVAVEAAAEEAPAKATNDQILEELRRIRKALEK